MCYSAGWVRTLAVVRTVGRRCTIAGILVGHRTERSSTKSVSVSEEMERFEPHATGAPGECEPALPVAQKFWLQRHPYTMMRPIVYARAGARVLAAEPEAAPSSDVVGVAGPVPIKTVCLSDKTFAPNVGK